MATRKASVIRNNEENHRIVAKSSIIQPVENVNIKRSAFGELGNRIENLQQTIIQDKDLKQHGRMDPPKCFAKKTTVIPCKKENKINGNITDAAKKKSLIRQESTLLKQLIKTEKEDPKKVTLAPTSSFKKTTIIDDPDINLIHEPNMAPEYLSDIFKYLREMETKYAIREDYLDEHESTPKMRAILVNWLVEAHLNFKCTLETLHICIGLIDRYLQENKKIGRSTLQLLGATSMLLACKYEEIYVPDLEDFEYICDNTFSKRQLLQMEKEILKRLKFNLGKPISIQFLRRYNKIAQAQLEHHILGKYLLELALLEHDLSPVKPSIQAAAACCLSMGILNDTMDLQKLWTPTLVHYTTYKYSDFRSVIGDLAMLIVKSEKSKNQASREKYASSRYLKMSRNPKLNGPLVRKLTLNRKNAT